MFQYGPENLSARPTVQVSNPGEQRQGGEHLLDGKGELMLGFSHGTGQKHNIILSMLNKVMSLRQAGIQNNYQGRENCQYHENI